MHGKIIQETLRYLFLRNLLVPINILGTILLVRFLHPGEYGKWFLVWNLISTGAPLLSLGWLDTLSKFLPELSDHNQKRNLFTQAFVVTLFSSCVIFLFYILAFHYLRSYIPLEIKAISISFYLFLLVSSFLNIFDGYYRGTGKFNLWTILGSLRSLCSLLCALFLLFFTAANFQTVFYSYFGIALLFLGILTVVHRNDFSCASLRLEKPILYFLCVSYVAQIALILKTNVDPVIIRLITHKSYELAYFEVGTKIPRILEALLLTPMAVPLLYYFSLPNPKLDKVELVVFGSKMIAFFFAAVSLALYSFADWIIPTLFSNAYQRSIPVLKIYAFVPFLASIFTLGHTYLFASNKPTVPTLFMLLGFILSLVLDLWWIPKFGILGAAYSSVFAAAIFAAGNLIYLSTHKIHVERVFYKLVLMFAISMSFNFVIPHSALPTFLLLTWATKQITLFEIKRAAGILSLDKS